MPQTTQSLESCIKYFDSKLLNDKWLMCPSTVGLVEATIKYLKELQEIKAELEELKDAA